MKKGPFKPEKMPEKRPEADEREYRKTVKKVLEMIRGDNLEGALEPARRGHALAVKLNDREGTSQALFVLNELRLYDESARYAREYWQGSHSWDETIFANSLCAWVSAGKEYLKDARSLMKKYRFESPQDWRRKFSSLDYNPSQITYIFNAALVFHHTGMQGRGRSLLREILGHIIFYIDSITGGSRDPGEDRIHDFALFLSLIGESEEFRDLVQGAEYHELYTLIYGDEES